MSKALEAIKSKRQHYCRQTKDKNCNCCVCQRKCKEDCDATYEERFKKMVDDRLTALEDKGRPH